MVSVVSDLAFDARRVAAEFVKARRSAGSFTQYPGATPPDLDSAYRCQDEAIALWDDSIAGWKVGWIPEPFSTKYGAQRLVGPIFSRTLQRSNGSLSADAPVFADGFAAIEAEFVFQLAKDAPVNVSEWSAETARRFVKTMFIGIEIASSPLQNINDFGPAAVASDFGNNAGLLLGAEVPDWQTRALESLNCETRIDGAVVGRGNAAAVSGGPLSALAFALRCNARRGRPLRAGDLVSTGAATGVHSIRAGQSAEAIFTGIGSLRCVARPMTPVS
ncbi:MAG TPA: fumarylacetoacetate hydrolase family protein [Steroidobacteraceae bacterium]